jgi:hypothetical protein
MSAPSAARTPDISAIVPDWVPELLAVGSERAPWITIPDALPFIPWPKNKAYRMAAAYLRRIERERKRRHSVLLPVDSLYAREGELPCDRDGRAIVLSKRLLIVKLLGYLPTIPGAQP